MSFKTIFFSSFIILLLAGCGKSSDIDLPILEADYTSNPELKEILSSEKTEKVKKEKVKTTEKKAKKKSKAKSKKKEIKTTTLASTQSFTGGKMADGLDMHKIRASANSAKTRLVFESYLWNVGKNMPTTQANNSGNYLFTYDSKTNTITALINGYRAFSALTGAKIATFPAGNMIKNIKLLPYMDDSGYKFIINIKEDAQVKVFELKNPGRIVVDIYKIY